MSSIPSTDSSRLVLGAGAAIERLVVPVLSDTGHDRGIETAVTWAARWELPILLVSVDTAGTGEVEAHLDRTRERLAAASHLSVTGQVLAVSDGPAGSDGIAGSLAGIIRDGDLVVMSSAGSPSGRPGASHAWSLVQAIDRPVLLVGPALAAPATLDGPVVVGLDGSDLAEQALPAATGLAAALGTRLWLVEAVPTGTVAQAEQLRARGEAVSTSAYLRRTASDVAAGSWDALGHHLAGADLGLPADAADAAATTTDTTTGAGSLGERVVWELVQSDQPAEALAAFGAERRAAVLVLSTHGASGLRADVLGSTCLEAVARASAPVLVIRPSGGDEPALTA
jgi:nucleotide-binding universal stress UspA family protein